MIEIIQGKNTKQITHLELIPRLQKYPKVVVDLGTGDGKYVYESARKNSQTFFIGIDADRNGLEEYSHKIARKKSKGGLDNVSYWISNVNNLPTEVEEIADEVWIILPWGSLLQAVVTAQEEFLRNIARITKIQGKIIVLVNYDLQYEPCKIAELGLPVLSKEYLAETLAKEYQKHHLAFLEYAILGNHQMTEIPSTWSRRLGFGRPRQTVQIIFQKV